MMPVRETSSENDVLYRFAMSYQYPDAEQLDEYVRRYPAYADALTTLAIELALERQIEKSEPTEEAHDSDVETDAMLSRAMSRFQNLLYEVRTSEEHLTPGRDPTRSVSGAPDLLAHRTPAQMQALGKRLDVSPLFLKRVRDREIRPDTIPKRFIALLAEGMQAVESEVALFLAGRPQVAAHLRFKSDVAPTAGRQITFEEAARSSALSPEQQARLLSLMRESI